MKGARRLAMIVTRSEDETVRFGEALGRELRTGDVVALVGPLGSGKTYFAKGLAKGLGVGADQIVKSPTFALINEYDGRVRVYHFDAYRFTDPAELEALGAVEILGGDNVSIVEWAERVEAALPDPHLRVEFDHVSPTERRVTLAAVGRFRELPRLVKEGLQRKDAETAKHAKKKTEN